MTAKVPISISAPQSSLETRRRTSSPRIGTPSRRLQNTTLRGTKRRSRVLFNRWRLVGIASYAYIPMTSSSSTPSKCHGRCLRYSHLRLLRQGNGHNPQRRYQHPRRHQRPVRMPPKHVPPVPVKIPGRHKILGSRCRKVQKRVMVFHSPNQCPSPVLCRAKLQIGLWPRPMRLHPLRLRQRVSS